MSGEELQKMRGYRRIRRFLGLRLFDVRAATGIPEQRLSAAETGRYALTGPEQALLESYLTVRLSILAQAEGWAKEEKGLMLSR